MNDTADLPDAPLAHESEEPVEPVEPDDGWGDDDVFGAPADGAGDTIELSRKGAIRAAQIGLVGLVLLVLLGVWLAKGGDDPDGAGGAAGPKAGTGHGSDLAKGRWHPDASGRPSALGRRGQVAPDVEPGEEAEPGAYIWTDFDGWHLWIVNGPGMPATHGTITSNDTVAKAVLAVPGVGTAKAEGTGITFDLPSEPELVGVDLNPGFFARDLTFTLEGPDGPIPDERVHLGAGAEPTSNPVRLHT